MKTYRTIGPVARHRFNKANGKLCVSPVDGSKIEVQPLQSASVLLIDAMSSEGCNLERFWRLGINLVDIRFGVADRGILQVAHRHIDAHIAEHDRSFLVRLRRTAKCKTQQTIWREDAVRAQAAD